MPARKSPVPHADSIPKRTPAANAGKAASALIDQRIAQLQDWRGRLLAELRAVILSADAAIVEEWKWNVPVWSLNGIICTGETYKTAVKLTFAKGASVPDPHGLFNSSLEGNTRRAIDLKEGASVDATALAGLVQAAIERNRQSGGRESAA